MLRSILGVVIGAADFIVTFFVLAEMLAMVWPDYATHGRQWINEGVFTFTPAMAGCNLVLWIIAAASAGWTAAKIAQRTQAVWVLAGIVGIYLATVHLVLDWPRFPWWYNLGVVIPAVPAVLWGARLAR
jgi:hypothetical protein